MIDRHPLFDVFLLLLLLVTVSGLFYQEGKRDGLQQCDATETQP